MSWGSGLGIYSGPRRVGVPKIVEVLDLKDYRGSSANVIFTKGSFTNYVYKIWLFLTTYPPPFTFSMV